MLKMISAGVGERIQYTAHKFNDTTIRFILKYPLLPDTKILSAAVKTVVDSVDVLHASFIAGANPAHWRVNKEYYISDYFSLIECDGDPMKIAKSLSLQPVEHRGKCQMHVTQVNGSDSCAVVIRISHLVADGSDGKYLINKLAECYRMIEHTGSADGLDIKNGNRSALCIYNEISKKDLLSLMKTPFSGIKTSYPFASPNEHGIHRMLDLTIPSGIISAAKEKAKSHGASVNDLLLTACYRSYAKTLNYRGKMSINSMIDLRQHCKDGVSEGLSNMSGGLSTVLEYTDGSSFASDLKIISDQTSAAKNNPLAGMDGMPLLHAATKTLPMWILLQAANVIYSNMSLNFTNLGNIPCAPLAMCSSAPTKGIFAGPLKRKPSTQIAAASFDGTAELVIIGDFTDEDVRSLNMLLDGILAEIEGYLGE